MNKKILLDGTYTVLNEKEKVTFTIKKSVLDGIVTIESLNKKEVMEFSNGKLDGTYCLYDKGGKPVEICTYVNGNETVSEKRLNKKMIKI